AAATNLLIPRTNVRYPKQQTNPVALIRTFSGYVRILWRDKLGQISLAVTTLFWGARATLPLFVIERDGGHSGCRLDQASLLMGVAPRGTAVGSIFAVRAPLRRAWAVLPVGVLMVIAVMLLTVVHDR